MKSFSSFHPIILFLYYICVLFITMLTMNPIILLFSILGSLLFFMAMLPLKIVLKELGFYSLLFLLIAVTNPIFSHNGETILFFLNDHPVTYEAIMYGVAIASMLIAVIFWSKSYNEVMTSDKFIYLFGKLIPKLSLVLSMALRFIPLFRSQIAKVHRAQRTLGLYTSDSFVDKLLSSIRVFNSILTWSLENAIQQSDSMKARGYGLKGRTSFSLFKMHARDIVMLVMILCLSGIIFVGLATEKFSFYYYPVITPLSIKGFPVMQYMIVFFFMVVPFIVEVKEQLQWKLLKLKM